MNKIADLRIFQGHRRAGNQVRGRLDMLYAALLQMILLLRNSG